MPSRVAALCCVALVLLAVVRPAHAWIENHVLGSEVRIEVQASGKALVEHRIRLKTTGSERLRELRIQGVDRDAVPEPNSYVIPARDALSSSLDSATPLSLELRHPKRRKRSEDSSAEPPLAELRVTVDSDHGLRRGAYVFVVRYRTDLRARELLRRDGSMVEIRWTGPRWDDGFDNTRITFVVPSAPTPPRAIDELVPDADDDEAQLTPRYLSEVRRGNEHDEVELLRSYAPKGERIAWAIRVDQRALEPLPAPAEAAPEPQVERAVRVADSPVERAWLIAAAALLLLLYSVLVVVKARQVARAAREAGAIVRPWVPLPVSLRAVAAGAALVGGVALQLLFDRPLPGAALVILAAALAAHGSAQLDPKTARRGPGRWLTVSESEALGPVPRLTGACLDASTREGKLLLILGLVLVSAAVYLLWPEAPLLASQVGLDSVALLAVFGTGRMSTMPPDLSVEPIRFYRKLVKRMGRMKAGRQLRIVPRIRIPNGEVDPDELRLLVVPRVPLRGFSGIEIGLTYALGFGARVGMPEVLLRVVRDSPCDEAVASLSRHARLSPGRKPEERALLFVPRLPTTRMTAEIAVALAARVTDLAPPSVPAPRPERKKSSKKRASKRRPAKRRAA